MRDIVVAMPSHTGLSDLAKAFEESPFEVIGPSEGRLVIRLDDEVVQFLHDQSLFEHYEEPNELTLLNSLGSHPNFFLVNFKNTNVLGQVLAYAIDRPDAMVDNDFGVIELGSTFVQHFREDPDWDWI